MLTRVFFVCAAILGSISVWGQSDNLLYRSRLQLQTGCGYFFSTSDYHTGSVTDQLISFRKNAFTINPIGVSVFLGKHWGLTGSFKLYINSNFREEAFQQGLETQFGGDHFITYKPYPGPEQPTFCFLLGGVYRYEQGRWKINLAALLGITSIEKYGASVFLKQKNTNRYTSVVYSPEKYQQDHFTMALSVRSIYTLTKNIGLHVGVTPSFFQAGIVYIERSNDLSHNSVSTQTVRHKNNNLSCTLEGGITLLVNSKKKR